MHRSLLVRQIVPSFFLYVLLIASALGADFLLHQIDVYWIGRYLGIAGTVLILLSFLYSLRKRKLLQRGSPKRLLELHEWLGWTGALMILVHAGVHFNALLPWAAVFMMLVVVASGFTGKHLLKEARERVTARQEGLRREGLEDTEVDGKLFLDSLSVDVMKKWRAIHLPLTSLFGALALLHILAILIFWRW